MHGKMQVSSGTLLGEEWGLGEVSWGEGVQSLHRKLVFKQLRNLHVLINI